MCSTVIFEYTCGCTERVVFKCPFSSTLYSSSSLRSRSNNCSRRQRRHLQELFQPPRPPHGQPLALRREIPALPLPSLPCPNSTTIGQLSETAATKLGEECHDCWRRSLQLEQDTNGKNADSSSSVARGADEERNTSRVLREMTPNELARMPPNSDVERMSSTEL
ncbi:hypothetical protein F5Y19DRAFT_469698 [Xylariaceae sp. FL1651]|nr:hypothetical protein F5Y19DRAFT_469698 [Xylariaceae sp. FL1651]